MDTSQQLKAIEVAADIMCLGAALFAIWITWQMYKRETRHDWAWEQFAKREAGEL